MVRHEVLPRGQRPRLRVGALRGGAYTPPLLSSTCAGVAIETTKSTSKPHSNCSRQAEKWTRVGSCLRALGAEGVEALLAGGEQVVGVQLLHEPGHLVAAQVETESKSRKQFIIFQVQALNSRRFQRGFNSDGVNLQRHTISTIHPCSLLAQLRHQVLAAHVDVESIFSNAVHHIVASSGGTKSGQPGQPGVSMGSTCTALGPTAAR